MQNKKKKVKVNKIAQNKHSLERLEDIHKDALKSNPLLNSTIVRNIPESFTDLVRLRHGKGFSGCCGPCFSQDLDASEWDRLDDTLPAGNRIDKNSSPVDGFDLTLVKKEIDRDGATPPSSPTHKTNSQPHTPKNKSPSPTPTIAASPAKTANVSNVLSSNEPCLLCILENFW